MSAIAAGKLTAESLQEFFRTGRSHIEKSSPPAAATAVSFPRDDPSTLAAASAGLLIPLAEVSEVCVGVDIAAAMLQEAAAQLRKYNRHNVRLARTLEEIDPGKRRGFSFIHSHMSCNTFEPQRGLSIIRALLSRLDSGGVAALHMTYAHTKHRANQGVRPRASRVMRFITRPLTPNPPPDHPRRSTDADVPLRPEPGAVPGAGLRRTQRRPAIHRSRRAPRRHPVPEAGRWGDATGEGPPPNWPDPQALALYCEVLRPSFGAPHSSSDPWPESP